MKYLLGIDAGTSVVKAALFDYDGHEVATSVRRTVLRSPYSGWAETNMDETWQMAVSAIQELLSKSSVTPDEISAVGVTGNMVGAWLIDEKGNALRDAVLHNDNRTQAWIEQQGSSFLPDIFRISGSVMQPGCTLPVIRWLADHEPQILARAAHVLCCKDWLIYKLTGAIQNDPSQASVMPGDTRERSYNQELFERFGISSYRDLFPVVVPSEMVVGGIHSDAVAQTGLKIGTPVVAGAGDVLATSIGSGAVQPGTAYTILGTALINGLVMDAPYLEPEDVGLTFCQPGGNWVRVMVNVMGTPNLDWFLENFFADLISQHGTSESLFTEIELRIANRVIGSGGVIYLPYLSPTGVFAPFVEPAARADFFGLTSSHTRDDLLRAVYEGIALSIRDCYSALPVEVDEIRLTGGGAKSAFWSQMIADCTGKRVVVPGGSEFGAKGAALLAGVGIGLYPSIREIAEATVDILRIHEPEPANSYDEIYDTYSSLAQALRSVWRMHSRR